MLLKFFKNVIDESHEHGMLKTPIGVIKCKERVLKINDDIVHQLIDYTIPLKSGPLTDLPFHTVHYHTQVAGITNPRATER